MQGRPTRPHRSTGSVEPPTDRTMSRRSVHGPTHQGELSACSTRREGIPPDLLQVVEEIGGGAWTRTTDLRIMRCAFRRAATRIQSLTVGSSDLKWDRTRLIGVELATNVATQS